MKIRFVLATVVITILSACSATVSPSNNNATMPQSNSNLVEMMNTNGNGQQNANTNSAQIRTTAKENTNAVGAAFTERMKTYNGQWFAIQYPEEFELKPRVDEMDPPATADEMYFASKDNKVEFFVFSPQWGGDPATYLEASTGETLETSKTETTGEGMDKKILTWGTFKAKNGSYLRSYLSIRAQVDTGSEVHHVFGIRYADQKTYDAYKGAYEAFKASLVQYADGYAGD